MVCGSQNNKLIDEGLAKLKTKKEKVAALKLQQKHTCFFSLKIKDN